MMFQNVLDMVFFVTGGKTMRKPYISKSNYITLREGMILSNEPGFYSQGKYQKIEK